MEFCRERLGGDAGAELGGTHCMSLHTSQLMNCGRWLEHNVQQFAIAEIVSVDAKVLFVLGNKRGARG